MNNYIIFFIVIINIIKVVWYNLNFFIDFFIKKINISSNFIDEHSYYK